MECQPLVKCVASTPLHYYWVLYFPLDLADGAHFGYDADFVQRTMQYFSPIASYLDLMYWPHSGDYSIEVESDSLHSDSISYDPMDSNYFANSRDPFHCELFDGDDFWLQLMEKD